MLNLISNNNLSEIKKNATQILALIKSKKFFISGSYSADVRVKASTTLLDISRAFKTDYCFNSITSEENLNELQSLIESLSSLLEDKTKFMTHKLKDYSLEIKPKLCRELISDLEDFYVLIFSFFFLFFVF